VGMGGSQRTLKGARSEVAVSGGDTGRLKGWDGQYVSCPEPRVRGQLCDRRRDRAAGCLRDVGASGSV
jgi:hypothetical protein